MIYRFIEHLREKYRVTELDHAFRINGVVDIYKEGGTVYEIPKNFYHKRLSHEQTQTLVNNLLLRWEERPDFKKAKHGITYQEFKQLKKEDKFNPDAVRAEDHHWKESIDVKSADHLYFAVIEDKVKIGRSGDVAERMKAMKTGFHKDPHVYVFRNKGGMERKMHEVFAEFRLKGEWFTYDFRIQNFIKKYLTHNAGYIMNPPKQKQYGKKQQTSGRHNKPVFGRLS